MGLQDLSGLGQKTMDWNDRELLLMQSIYWAAYSNSKVQAVVNFRPEKGTQHEHGLPPSITKDAPSAQNDCQ